jgi:hypothetical protein
MLQRKAAKVAARVDVSSVLVEFTGLCDIRCAELDVERRCPESK